MRPRRQETDRPPARVRLVTALALLVLLKYLLFAWALPVFEGVDEPFHLDRVRAFAEGSLAEGWRGRPLAAEVVAAVRASPCGEDLRRVFGCPRFAGEAGFDAPAWFNALASPVKDEGGSEPIANYQDHQPPLYYALAGAALRLTGAGEPRHQLLALRLFAVLLVAFGVALSLRLLAPPQRLALLAALLLPGAAEALVRAGNDTLVFSWCAALLVVLARDGGRQASTRRLPGLFALAALGPLAKLTALPVVVFAALERLERGRRGEASALALGGLIVFPLQLARGWAFGGTLELGAPARQVSAWWEPVLGVVHSAYTFAKTALWLGGWSVFRPPVWVLVAAAALAVAWLGLVRPQRRPRALTAHLAAAAFAGVAFVAFAIGKHRLFGVWGAVGGWYLWGWLPWLLLAHRDLVAFPWASRAGRVWTLAAALFLLAVNVAWLAAAHRLYGG